MALLVLSGQFWEALALFAFAGASDAADGFLAKRFGLTSNFGRILDPAADKLLMLASFVALALVHEAPLWLAALVISRDLLIVLGAGLVWLLEMPLRLAPLPLGKICTALQIGYIAVMLVLLLTGQHLPVTEIAMAVAVGGFTVASGLNYAALWLKALNRAGSRIA
jgi:cardiolipin synthase